MIKKFYAVLVMVCACLSSICGFATPSGENSTVVISQVDAVDYVIIIGGVIFLIGMLFILLSMYAKVKNKEADDLYDDAEGYDADEDDYEEEVAAVENETQDAEEAEVAEPEAEVTDSEETAETEEAEEAEEVAPEEAAEAVAEEVVVQKESVVRVTMTGTNNADVKIAEFSHSAKVGRRGTNDIMISDNAVSGEHCEFIYDDGIVYLQDLNSTNGTLLNGETIEREEVKTGDLIIIGKHQYKINISL